MAYKTVRDILNFVEDYPSPSPDGVLRGDGEIREFLRALEGEIAALLENPDCRYIPGDAPGFT